MSKASIIRTAFNTIIEASILESRKEQEKGLTAAQKRAKRDAETGVGQRAPAYRDFVHKTTKGAGNPYRPATEYLRRLSPVSNITTGELYDGDKDKIKKSLAGRLARTATSPEVRKRAGEKLLAKENIMNYRQSLRTLFEAVIEEAAVRTPKKVRGALEKDERGIATQDGPEELVADIVKRHPEKSPIGRKARKMAFQYRQERGEREEKDEEETRQIMRRRYLGIHNPKD